MKVFCSFCNNEAMSICGECMKPICQNHQLSSYRCFKGDFEDFVGLQFFLHSNFSKDFPPYTRHSATYRNFYEKILKESITNPTPTWKEDYCKNCSQIVLDYFDKTVLPIVQKAQLNGDICGIYRWCLCDAVDRCNGCGKYACFDHLRLCNVCDKAYCAGHWVYNDWSYTDDPNGSDKNCKNCACRHSHSRQRIHWIEIRGK